MTNSDEDNSAQSSTYSLGAQLYNQGQYAQAIDELTKLQQPGLLADIGRFYMGMAHRALGLEQLAAERYAQAEEHFRQAMAVLGATAELGQYLASLYARSGRLERCCDEMERLLDGGRNSLPLWRKTALAQWQSGRRPQAYMTLWQAMRTLGPDPSLHLQIGAFLAAEGRYEQARPYLERAAHGDSTSSKAHYYLGLVAAACSDVWLAVRSFQRALELCPQNVMLAYNLSTAARAASEQGHRVVVQLCDRQARTEDGQMRQLAHYVTTEPDFVEAFLALPASDTDADLFGLLAGVVQTALAEHPEFADLHLHLSRIYQRLGQQEGALEHARRAAEINPRYVKALVQQARLEAQAGERAPALAAVRQAIACGADWPDVHYFAGELLEGQDRSAAKEHLRRALELKPSFAPAKVLLDSLAA